LKLLEILQIRGYYQKLEIMKKRQKLEIADASHVKYDIVKGTMSAGAHALSSPVGRFLRGVFLRRFV